MVLLVNSSLAGTMGPVLPRWNWVATLSAGAAWESAGKTQTFFLAPEIEKTYKAHKSSHSLFDGELFFGVQNSLFNALQGQFGLALAATSSAKLSGRIWDDADVLFDNHSYKYKIQHTHIAAKGKLLAGADLWLTPWISGSIGVGFNDASSYQNIPTIYEALPNPNFRKHSKTSFTYTVGAGVQKTLTDNWQVGVGYEFADWGKSRLGCAPGQTINSGIALDHLYTNGVMFNVSYII